MEQKDFNRLTIEANNKLMGAVCNAMMELQGEQRFADAVMENDLLAQLTPVQVMSSRRMFDHDRAKLKYERMSLNELLAALYNVIQTYHHYGACKGRDLPGIAWYMDDDDVFIITLKDCALNMEHSITDEARLPGYEGSIDELEGRLFCIAYDPDIDCNDPDGEFYGHYEESLSFYAEFEDEDDNVDRRNVTICDVWNHRELLRDLLAELDIIADMANKTE